MEGQTAITKDNFSVGVNAIGLMKGKNAEKVRTSVEDYVGAVSKYFQAPIARAGASLDNVVASTV
ncbi:MAG: hypothetical protein V1915_04075 [Candidatus Bathyarchaeota archaeon]